MLQEYVVPDLQLQADSFEDILHANTVCSFLNETSSSRVIGRRVSIEY